MKPFRLYKRDDTGRELKPDAPGYRDRYYYFKFNHRSKRHVRCLETPDAVEAQKRARLKYNEITQAVINGEYRRLDATKLRQDHTVTLEDIFAAYRKGPADANLDTRNMNIRSLESIAGETAKSLRDLTPASIRKFFELANAAALAEPDQQKAASLKRSANSTWAKAKSLFTTKCQAHYRDLELYRDQDPHHASIQAFLVAGEAAKFTGRSVPKIAYNAPNDEIINQTLQDWQDLQDRDLFLAIGHELAFGLRIAEMAQAQWSWWTVRAGYPVLDATGRVKSGTGIIQVRALDPWFNIMRTRAITQNWIPENKDQLIIQGTEAYCTDGLFRSVSDWLRQRGWKTKKTNHALRAYAGSQVAMKYGIYDAQIWLRHSTVKVTETNYSHFVKQFKPEDTDTIPARWATVKTEFVPVVLPAVGKQVISI